MAAPSQQRRLLFRRPFPPPLNPRNNLHVHRSGLLLELQKEAPQEANIAAKAALRYTWQGGRLQKFWGFDPTSTSAVDFPHLENHWPQRLANSRAGRRPRGEHGPGPQDPHRTSMVEALGNGAGDDCAALGSGAFTTRVAPGRSCPMRTRRAVFAAYAVGRYWRSDCFQESGCDLLISDVLLLG
jgi:hypothetical protein